MTKTVSAEHVAYFTSKAVFIMPLLPMKILYSENPKSQCKTVIKVLIIQFKLKKGLL